MCFSKGKRELWLSHKEWVKMLITEDRICKYAYLLSFTIYFMAFAPLAEQVTLNVISY